MSLNRQQFEQLEMFPGQGSDVRSFKPVEKYADMAAGMGYSDDGISSMGLSPQRLFMLGKEYQRRLGRTTASPSLKRSYDVLRQHTNEQFDAIKQSGLDVSIGDHFYNGPREMADDLRSGQLKVSRTTPDQSSAVFSDEENDKFRAVHDVMGHGVTGRGFSPSDEYAAYEGHARTLPPAARKALFSEVVGQAAYWGVTGEFAPQTKNVVEMPNWAVEGRDPVNRKRSYVSRYKQQRLF
ncbi:MAG: hypothetical protein EBR40_09090 [Proteobacteria bacterium]|nr:hypothetical protein [Pseudomonadota bacterium]